MTAVALNRSSLGLQLQLVGDFRGDVLEGDGRPRDAFEAHAVEREAGQFAHLHLPLDEAVLAGVAVDAEEQEALALLVIAVVGVQHLADFPHHVSGLHGGRGLHAPGKTQRSGLGVAALLFGFPGSAPERTTQETPQKSVTSKN